MEFHSMGPLNTVQLGFLIPFLLGFRKSSRPTLLIEDSIKMCALPGYATSANEMS